MLFRSFLNTWTTTEMQLSVLCDPKDLPSPEAQKAQLQAAVMPHAARANVSQSESISIARGEDAMNYTQYLSVLKTAGAMNDNKTTTNFPAMRLNQTKDGDISQIAQTSYVRLYG